MTGRLPDSPPLSHWIQLRPWWTNLAVALLYWGFAELGFLLAEIHGNVSPLWPPSGLAIAAVYFFGARILPAVFGGALLANAFTGIAAPSVVAIACGNAGEAAVALLLLRSIRPLGSFLGDYATPCWLLATSLLAPTVSALIGSLAIVALNDPGGSLDWSAVALTWWAGDAIGTLIVAPVLLSAKKPSFRLDWCLKVLLLAGLCFFAFSLVFFHREGAPLLFLTLPLLIPACKWFGPPGCALCTAGFVVFSAAVAHWQQPLLGASTLNGEILILDIFLFALAVTSLTIATFYRKNQFVIPGTLFAIGWAVSGMLFYSLRTASEEIDRNHFLDIVSDAEAAVEARMQTYTDALIAGAGLYLNSEELRPTEWSSFVDQLNLSDRYPGINGLGFIQPFDAETLEAYVQEAHREGRDGFTIKEVPHVERPPEDEAGLPHFVITYIEPIEPNRQALGLDVASETNRQQAAQRSRDRGEPVMTDRIILVQDGLERPGFLVFLPMYRPGMPTSTVVERRAALVGWSYAPFITELFLDGVLGNRATQIEFDIFDSPRIGESSFVYSTNPSDQSDPNNSSFDHSSTLDLAGQTFSFGWNRGESFQRHETMSASITAASLALGTCLLVGIVVNLQSTNRRATGIVEARTRELRETNQKLRREVAVREKAESDAMEARRNAEAANLAKSEFLATMSHEIRTPMNSVLGFAELLAGSRLDPEQRLWASYIQASGSSLLRIINDILDFSKIEAGKLELEIIAFSPGKALDEVVSSFTTLAAQKGLLIDSKLADNFPRKVAGDPIRLKQVITNLIANALKFTEHGSILVTATWEGDDQQGTAHFRVKDTGIGIPADKIDTLFGRFRQVDSSTTRRFGGTGLGLAICKRIVQLMNGRIWAESTLGKGTTMAFDIPFQVPEHSTQPTRPPFVAASVPPPPEERFDLRVLLVDDNSVNKKLGMTVLRRLGCQVSLASNGLEATQHVQQQGFDMVFLDCQMPVMDGYEAARRIRHLEASGQLAETGGTRPLTIVALTANSSEEDRQHCLDSGMDLYLRKPCKIEDFKQALMAHGEKQEVGRG